MTRDPKGFTLLELLVGSTIFLTVLAAVYTAFLTNQTTFSRGKNKIEVQQNGRLAMEMMARDIRMAGYDPSTVIAGCAQPTALQSGTANSVNFIADVTDSGTTGKVTYRLAGGQLIRDVSSWNGTPCGWNPATSSVVADDIAAVTFQYFDGTNAAIAAPVAAGSLGTVRRITMSVTTQAMAKGTAAKLETFPLTMDIRFRNL